MSSQTVSQHDIIRHNIGAINEAQREELTARSTFDRISDFITNFSGSLLFVLMHVFWFGLWILLNIGLLHIPRVSEFDPFPFGLLTMIVSLEAIFLSTFVLISQNRMAKLNEQRAELDLHINLLAEQKATKALELLDQLIQQLNTLEQFNFKHDPEVKALKVSPQPQEVIQVMKETIAEQAETAKQEVREVAKETVAEMTEKMRAIRDEVKEVTGETHGVRQEVAQVDHKVEEVAGDLQDIKEEVKALTGEHREVSLK